MTALAVPTAADLVHLFDALFLASYKPSESFDSRRSSADGDIWVGRGTVAEDVAYWKGVLRTGSGDLDGGIEALMRAVKKERLALIFMA